MTIPLTSLLMIGLLLHQPLPIAESEDPTLRDLLTDSEYQNYQKDPRYNKRIDLFRKIFKHRGEMLRDLVRSNKHGEISKLLKKLGKICPHVTSESSKAKKEDLLSKQVKRLEIVLRKLIETLEDLKLSTPFENQDDFNSTNETLEKLRRILLKQLFGDLITRITSGQESRIRGMTASLAHWDNHLVELSTTAQKGHYRLALEDRFTDEEYQQIQFNQELNNRVEVFLDIAESRLREIQRRMNGRKWEEDHTNPLEFHTHWDMMHAYRQALNSLMINIDEKVTYKSAAQMEVQQSLMNLSEKLQYFIPQLNPIRQFAKNRRDNNFYLEVLKAQKTSEAAQKGSQHGLRVLEKEVLGH